MTAASRPARAVPAAIVERLKAVVGPNGYLEAEGDIAPFCRGWRDDWQGRVPLVVRPATTAEVAAVVGICAETRTPIVPQGGNTGLTGASQPGPDMSEIVLSTSRLKCVREVDTLNDTITVEAGVVLADIQRVAAEHGRLFPLSLGAEGSCQIGGNISTNAGGVQVIRYGNTRSLVLGLEVVLADGRIWDGLRALRKDNTGYDLKQLFIGAEGTLGIVTAAVLRLFPRPTASETAWLAVPSPAAAVDLLAHLRAAFGEQISAFELIGSVIVDLVVAGMPGHDYPFAERHGWYVLTEVAGQGAPGSLAEPFAATLAEAMEKGLVRDAVIAASSAQSGRFWRMREDMAEAQKVAGGSITHDVSVPLARLPKFIAAADAAMASAYPGVRLVCFGHVGDGNMHYNPMRPVGSEVARWKAERAAINRIVHDLVIAHGGSISAEHGIGRLRLAENERYKSAVELDLMRALKRTLDPAGIMNPGKVIR
jgi:FAD/FMN-containing dehydrogenase